MVSNGVGRGRACGQGNAAAASQGGGERVRVRRRGPGALIHNAQGTFYGGPSWDYYGGAVPVVGRAAAGSRLAALPCCSAPEPRAPSPKPSVCACVLLMCVFVVQVTDPVSGKASGSVIQKGAKVKQHTGEAVIRGPGEEAVGVSTERK
jgi:hypothetical protein